ncbi:LamG domain-containing protein [Ponticaulis koreensis]|uniref:hypothetical protein n=1 Tax=Ponticaulis koreensis TaxID=1123045 RepID=UPI0003B6C935|nr:hypothetical protein [Ponticaulis koreensis]
MLYRLACIICASCIALSAPALAETGAHEELIITENGITWLDLPDHKNGTTSFELWMSPGRAFTGFLFRAPDAQNGEILYLRHHQQGNPDAWQYHPRYNGHQAYQIYQGEGFAGVTNVTMGEWVSGELVVSDDRAILRVNGEVVAAVGDLIRDPESGQIGVWALRGERRFRNLSFSSEVEDISALVPPPQEQVSSEGLIADWSFSASVSAEVAVSPEGVVYENALSAGHRGLVDMNQLTPLSSEANTIFASVTVTSPEPQMVLLDLAFSDKASVFLNGELLYSGTDVFLTRDYRFLGTAGFNDTVPLYLNAGDNQLEIAVTEQEGGWTIGGTLRGGEGVTTRLRD